MRKKKIFLLLFLLHPLRNSVQFEIHLGSEEKCWGVRIDGSGAGSYEGEIIQSLRWFAFRNTKKKKSKFLVLIGVCPRLLRIEIRLTYVYPACCKALMASRLLWLWVPRCSQPHMKFLPILALHAVVCAILIGNFLAALFSSFPKQACIFCCAVYLISS